MRIDLFRQGELAEREVGHDRVDGRELMRVIAQECAQSFDLAQAGGVGMNADGPQAFRFLQRAPELLRNPREAAAHEGNAREAVGQEMNALGLEGAERAGIESVLRRNPNPGIEPMLAQNVEPFGDPGALPMPWNARELRRTLQRHKAAPAALAQMVVSV
ncbi:MAG TPA: hypothetical protein VMD55_08085 [Terracidiphilus sp.]|nr:hypothetical protein [Terracidiphilus sp.]